MVYVLALIILLLVALIIIRVGTVALMLTGVSHSLARFQARSAFFQVGFTTAEAETVVNHPVRREIIMAMILAGNAGFVTVVSTVILSFTKTPEDGLWGDLWFRLVVLTLGLVLLWLISYSKWIERRLNAMVSWALRRFMHLQAHDYVELLRLSSDHSVMQFRVLPDSWLAGRKLMDLRLADEGIMVIGLQRGAGEYLGAPRGSAWIYASDTLIAYCKKAVVQELEHRPGGEAGDLAHEKAVERRRAIEQGSKQS